MSLAIFVVEGCGMHPKLKIQTFLLFLYEMLSTNFFKARLRLYTQELSTYFSLYQQKML